VRSAGVLLILVASCARDEADALCPPVSEGELVVTEVRGNQDDDTVPPWVEIYNASPTTVDLLGARLRFRSLDGSSEIAVLVRRTVNVAAGGYVVLGLTPDQGRPDHIDYGFASDYPMAWQSSRALDVESCGERIDRVQFSSLPGEGTFALGTNPPSADANDLPGSWCTDRTMVGTTFPGTPGAANPACP
jgi:hypothetical protein